MRNVGRQHLWAEPEELEEDEEQYLTPDSIRLANWLMAGIVVTLAVAVVVAQSIRWWVR